MSGNAVQLRGSNASTVAAAITRGERMLTMKAIREEKGIPFCDQYIWLLRQRGLWPEPVKFGRRLMFFESEIDAMLARMKAKRDAEVTARQGPITQPEITRAPDTGSRQF